VQALRHRAAAGRHRRPLGGRLTAGARYAGLAGLAALALSATAARGVAARRDGGLAWLPADCSDGVLSPAQHHRYLDQLRTEAFTGGGGSSMGCDGGASVGACYDDLSCTWRYRGYRDGELVVEVTRYQSGEREAWVTPVKD